MSVMSIVVSTIGIATVSVYRIIPAAGDIPTWCASQCGGLRVLILPVVAVRRAVDRPRLGPSRMVRRVIAAAATPRTRSDPQDVLFVQSCTGPQQQPGLAVFQWQRIALVIDRVIVALSMIRQR